MFFKCAWNILANWVKSCMLLVSQACYHMKNLVAYISERLWYLQCVSNRDTAFLHEATELVPGHQQA